MKLFFLSRGLEEWNNKEGGPAISSRRRSTKHTVLAFYAIVDTNSRSYSSSLFKEVGAAADAAPAPAATTTIPPGVLRTSWYRQLSRPRRPGMGDALKDTV